MGLFNDLMSKLFSHSTSTQAGSAASSATGAASSTSAGQPSQTAQSPSGSPAGSRSVGTPTPTQQVDVTAVLDGLAAKNPEKLDWRHSIVDLMKLVGMDSSLKARKQLATELQYNGDQNDSAAMNIWLHKQVLRKISENGGKVPAELLR